MNELKVEKLLKEDKEIVEKVIEEDAKTLGVKMKEENKEEDEEEE